MLSFGLYNKATFYYTAEKRVDFRQLIKDMGQAFGIRIEKPNRPAGRSLAFGRGRLRAASLLLHLPTDGTVSTAAARYQQLSLNPENLAGQCGKLKCCLTLN